MHIGGIGKVAQVWPYSRWLVFYTLPGQTLILLGTAVTAGNIVFEIDAGRDELNSDFADSKLPPCKIERNISIDGVEYPIVRSHSVPGYVEWDADWGHINRQLMNLINLGHGTWPCR